MDNFFVSILNEYGISYEVQGSEIWYKCPLPGHNNNDVNFSASYSVAKNMCNCFVHGGDLIFLLMHITKKSKDDVYKILKNNKEKIERSKTEYICQSVLENKDVKINPGSVFSYKRKIHRDYTFKNFTTKIDLIKKLEIGFDEIERRVTVPVKNRNGEYVFVVKRAISPTAKLRYKYEPKDCIKSDYVYGINFWKDPEYLIVVEGVKDAIRCIDKGIKNVVAIFGSKPSKKQMDILRNKCSKLYIALDDDKAGDIGNEMFKKNYRLFFNGMYFFKHPPITKDEIEKRYRRDIAIYTKCEILQGIKEASRFMGAEIHDVWK